MMHLRILGPTWLRFSFPLVLALTFAASGCQRSGVRGEDSHLANRSLDSGRAGEMRDPGETSSEAEEIRWRLQYTAKCSQGTELAHCKAAYGFVLDSRGAYELGPTPDGQKLRGAMTADELQRLTTLLDESVGNLSCGGATGTQSASIHLMRRTEGVSVNCDLDPIGETTAAIRAVAEGLAEKYSPSVFPNPCTTSAFEFEELIGELGHCEIDSDCAPIDGSFQPIGPEDSEGAGDDRIERSCSWIHVPRRGNAFKFVSHQLQLVLLQRIVVGVCGESALRPGCDPQTSFRIGEQEVNARPRCVRNRCR